MSYFWPFQIRRQENSSREESVILQSVTQDEWEFVCNVVFRWKEREWEEGVTTQLDAGQAEAIAQQRRVIVRYTMEWEQSSEKMRYVESAPRLWEQEKK